MRVVVSPLAELDFEAQVKWLHAHSPSAGRAVSTRIVEVLDLLADFPNLGMVVRADIREKQVQFGRDGFVIRYRRSARVITVLRVFHTRQDR